MYILETSKDIWNPSRSFRSACRTCAKSAKTVCVSCILNIPPALSRSDEIDAHARQAYRCREFGLLLERSWRFRWCMLILPRTLTPCVEACVHDRRRFEFKLIRKYLRNIMTQIRSCNLAMTSIKRN